MGKRTLLVLSVLKYPLWSFKHWDVIHREWTSKSV